MNRKLYVREGTNYDGSVAMELQHRQLMERHCLELFSYFFSFWTSVKGPVVMRSHAIHSPPSDLTATFSTNSSGRERTHEPRTKQAGLVVGLTGSPKTWIRFTHAYIICKYVHIIIL